MFEIGDRVRSTWPNNAGQVGTVMTEMENGCHWIQFDEPAPTGVNMGYNSDGWSEFSTILLRYTEQGARVPGAAVRAFKAFLAKEREVQRV